jgi:3-deoxy-D-manno-octulosonic-acid transferase
METNCGRVSARVPPAGIPAVIVNGKFPEKSFRRYRLIRFVAKL